MVKGTDYTPRQNQLYTIRSMTLHLLSILFCAHGVFTSDSKQAPLAAAGHIATIGPNQAVLAPVLSVLVRVRDTWGSVV